METIIKGLKIDSFSYDGGGSGGLDYSTSEQDTGRKWIDGETVYCRSFLLTEQQLNQFNSTGSIDLQVTTASRIGVCLNNFFYGRVMGEIFVHEFLDYLQNTTMWSDNLTKEIDVGYYPAIVHLRKGSRYTRSFGLIYGYIEYTKSNS